MHMILYLMYDIILANEASVENHAAILLSDVMISVQKPHTFPLYLVMIALREMKTKLLK